MYAKCSAGIAFAEALIMLRHDFESAKVQKYTEFRRIKWNPGTLLSPKFKNPLKSRVLFCGFCGSMHLYEIPRPSFIMRTKHLFLAVLSAFFLFLEANGQKRPEAKYPSLFWEITGNGLKKPSYLFGTMHVSSKMVFHLSDSFYLAIRNVDAVALELNPDLWQEQMVSMDNMKRNYLDFVQAPGGDYLNENSFRVGKYNEELKRAMSTEPTAVNSLLYRSFKSKEDFEEDTFLDLYIFQTGKKLGKRSTGVEDYFETEKIVMEAYADMANEKKKKYVDMDGESGADMEEKIQDAYRKGDLDLMDSLDKKMERSDAFREKFLYKRNEIQANSIDTIMKKSSLFVGVGAAHLAGDRGVIELLRKKGYRLRPVKMTDRGAVQKENIDKLKVPVEFKTRIADDGFYSVDMPGPLFKLRDENQPLNRRQYSDMSNGSYYLVTRVKTHAAFLGQNENDVLKYTDSILYENIPGKILSKKIITRNGYKGYDISNRTRRGDIQRYNIFITPFEILIFKIGGTGNYAEGREAERFFSSIRFREKKNMPLLYEPGQGGFSVRFPQPPYASIEKNEEDNTERWEYEAVDSASGTAYLVIKRPVYNFRFLDQDSFDLGMIGESFRNPDQFEKQLYRKPGLFFGYPCLDVKEKMKDGTDLTAKYVIHGPHYYVIAARGGKGKNDFNDFFESFRFTGYKYKAPVNFTDTFFHFTVNTPVAPVLDEGLRGLIEKTSADIANGYNSGANKAYWPKTKNGLFRNDSTGEMIGVSIQEFPRYYYLKKPALFWKDELESFYRNDMVLYRSDSLLTGGKISGYRFTLRDTGSSRTISRMLMLKGNFMYSLVTMGDTLSAPGNFVRSFFDSFKPDETIAQKNIFENRLEDFFTDLFSKDSTVHARAKQSIPNIYYGEKGIPGIMDAINRLHISDKDYFETKSALIGELGYIRDTANPRVVSLLRKMYEQIGDTSTFQFDILLALIRHKTADSYAALKTLLLQDPPVFENRYDCNRMFGRLDDSLKLTASLFPDLLQLVSLDDYKENIIHLLSAAVDSNLISGADYANYFSKIYFDARILLKKQQSKDEAAMMEELKKTDPDTDPVRYDNDSYKQSGLGEYSTLLMPYYDKNSNVQKYFEKLLNSRDLNIRLHTAVLMLRNHKEVADSIINSLVTKELCRAELYSALEKVKRLDKFPVKYRNQVDMARSLLLADKEYDNVDSLVFLNKQQVAYSAKRGAVYFFKYRVKKEDDWKIGISGLQPENDKEISSDDDLVVMTDKKLKPGEPMQEQLQKELQKLLFSFHKSGKYFFSSERNYDRYNGASDYGD